MRLPRRRHRPRRHLSEQAHQAHHSLCGRRLDRPDGAADGQVAVRAVRAAGGGREPPRRGRHPGAGLRGQGARRWLHAAVQRRGPARGNPARLSQARLRPDQVLLSDHAGGDAAAAASSQARAQGQQRQRIDRRGQRQTRQALLRLVRQRQRRPPGGRVLQDARRRGHGARAVQGQRTSAGRSRRRPDRPNVRRLQHLGTAGQGRQASRHRDHLDAEVTAVPAGADHAAGWRVADFEAGTWFGLLAPANTPRPIIDRLSHETNAALQEKELQEILASQGASVRGGTPDQFKTYFLAEFNKWGKIVKSAGITAE
nr:tripartite tricarboxylate transporter substrate-binding protein [Variovorax sp. OV700]